MKKIVHIAYSGLGGHGAVLFSLLENGFMPECEHAVLFAGVESPRDEYLDRCRKLGIEALYVPRVAGTPYSRFVFAMYKALQRVDPEYIFAHGLAAVPASVLYKLMTSLSKRRVLILRETQAHHLKSARDWVLLAAAYGFFSKVVYLTPEACSGAKAKLRFLFSAKKSTVIGNGLDLDTFSYRYKPKAGDVIKLGMQSRLQANKDHSTLVEAFGRLVLEMPDAGLSLHLAGDGETLGAIKGLVASRKLDDKVFFHGMLGQPALIDFLSGLTIYVHSTHGETMSTAIMQALAIGLPVIASDVGGVSNMMQGDHGLLFELGNVDDLLAKIHWLLDDETFSNSISRKARIYAEREFDGSALVQKYSRLFSA